MKIYALKVNGLVDPMGYLYDALAVSWKVKEAMGKKQRNAKVKVFRQESLIYETEGNSLGTRLDFMLEPYTRYNVCVTVESDAGEMAEESCYFETAKLTEPWIAKWLGWEADGTCHPEFQKRFKLYKNIRSARLYITGLGVFEAFVNGKKAGNDLLAPFINDYAEHIQYCTIDVTKQLADENEITVLLGNGWYRGRFGLFGLAHYERPFALIAELRIVYEDGTVQTIGTDENWQVREGLIRASDIYDGETQDYSYGCSEWQAAKVIEAPARLVERYSPPVTAHECFPVKELLHTPKGETVLDFGQNMAGYVEVVTNQSFTLEFGEILQDGNFYHENYRTAKSIFRYISDGKERAVRPYFTFFGFRYVKVSGMDEVDISRFKARAVYSDMERTGWLETGNAEINRLHENVLWGLKSNFLDHPTDCPQRDERIGWCGDAQVFCPTAGYLMDTRAFYSKFLRDLRSDQKRNHGKVAMYLPNEFNGLAAAVWSDIATILPQMLYDYYGSIDILRMNYPLMRDWVDSVRREDEARGRKNLWDFGFQYGDWLALDGPTEQSNMGRTDKEYIASMYYYNSARITAEAAHVLGYEEADEYRQLAEDIRTAILKEYFSENGRLAIDTQSGYLIALRFGVYTDQKRLTDKLKARIKNDLYRIKGGFVGATMANKVLADYGMENLAYDFLFYDGFPGWLYAVRLGATTIWERWNSVLPDGKISGTSMNSLNHYSFGSVMEFVYCHAAGIQPAAPGFKRARIAPKPDIRFGKLDCCFESAGGKYVSKWEIREDGGVDFHIEIPFDCEGEIELPEQEKITVSAGVYDYSIKTKRDYRALYTGDTPMEQLIENKSAVDALNQYLPGTVDSLNRKDAEAMSKSLADMRYRAMLFRQPTDGFDRAIEAVSSIRKA